MKKIMKFPLNSLIPCAIISPLGFYMDISGAGKLVQNIQVLDMQACQLTFESSIPGTHLKVKGNN